MKSEPDLEDKEENFAEKKTFYRKCLAKDIKLSNFLGGNQKFFYFSWLACFG